MALVSSSGGEAVFRASGADGEGWVEAHISGVGSTRENIVIVGDGATPTGIYAYHGTDETPGWCRGIDRNKLKLEFLSNAQLYSSVQYRLRLINTEDNAVAYTYPGTFMGGSEVQISYSPPSSCYWYEVQVLPVACGADDWRSVQEIEFADCSAASRYVVSPNPSESAVSIMHASGGVSGLSLSVASAASTSGTAELSVLISSSAMGEAVKSANAAIGEKIDISSLPSGIYIVSIYENGKFAESHKLIVK